METGRVSAHLEACQPLHMPIVQFTLTHVMVHNAGGPALEACLAFQ